MIIYDHHMRDQIIPLKGLIIEGGPTSVTP